MSQNFKQPGKVLTFLGSQLVCPAGNNKPTAGDPVIGFRVANGAGLPALVDGSGGAVSNAIAAIAAGAAYAQADLVAVKNAIASIAADLNLLLAIVGGAAIVGIAEVTASAVTDTVPVNTQGVYTVAGVVAKTNGAVNSAIAIGDRLFISAAAIVSKDSSGTFFGTAVTTLGAGNTGAVDVSLGSAI
jgi:hypothetical protein